MQIGSAEPKREGVWPTGETSKSARDSALWSPAIRVGDWIFVSGHFAGNYDRGLADEAFNPPNPSLVDELEVQSRILFERLSETLTAAGSRLSDSVVRVNQWFPSPFPTPDELAQGITWPRITIGSYLRVLSERIPHRRPASTALAVRKLLATGARVEVDLIAMQAPLGNEMVSIQPSPGEPRPSIGYSPAIRCGDWVFASGAIAADYADDFWHQTSAVAHSAQPNPFFWHGSSVESQADYVLGQLDKLVQAGGSDLGRCVHAAIYTANPSDFPLIDRVWKRWFPLNPPARTIVPSIGLGGKGCQIEIALTLVTTESRIDLRPIVAPDVPLPHGHEPHAMRAGNLLFFSTQQPNGPAGDLAEETRASLALPYHRQSPKLQMRYILRNVAKICESAGTSLANLCKGHAFHADFGSFAETIEEWRNNFSDDPPALTNVEIGKSMLIPGSAIAMDLIGFVPS